MINSTYPSIFVKNVILRDVSHEFSKKVGTYKLNNTNFHKNEEYNLVPLCQKCHDDEHSGTLKIKGYIDTSNGKKLLYDKINQDYSQLKKHISYDDKKWKFNRFIESRN